MNSNIQNFLGELNTLEGGMVERTQPLVFKDEIDEARHLFARAGKKVIDDIDNGGSAITKFGLPKTSWTEQTDHTGRVKVEFRHDGRTLELVEGKTYFYVPDAEAAKTLVAKVIIAAEQGALDSHICVKKNKKPSKAGEFVRGVKQSWTGMATA